MDNTKKMVQKWVGIITIILGFSNLVQTGIAHKFLSRYLDAVAGEFEIIVAYLNYYDYVYRFILPGSVIATLILLVLKESRSRLLIIGFLMNAVAYGWIYYILHPTY